MDLLLKALAGGVIIIAIGLLSRNSENALAAVMIQVPVITIFGLWAAGAAGGSQEMGKLALAAMISAPLFWSFTLAVFLLRGSGLPPTAIIAIACCTWLLTTLVWLVIFRDQL